MLRGKRPCDRGGIAATTGWQPDHERGDGAQSAARDSRLPAGWWVLPALLLGLMAWAAIAAILAPPIFGLVLAMTRGPSP